MRTEDDIRLYEAVSAELKQLSVTEVIGPPMAYFDTGEGADRYRHVYEVFLYGVGPDFEGSRDRHGIIGRYKDTGDLIGAVVQDLKKRLTPGQPLVWRLTPEVREEAGYLKAYLRYTQVPTLAMANEAVVLAKKITDA